jgi:hypothetical protein
MGRVFLSLLVFLIFLIVGLSGCGGSIVNSSENTSFGIFN